MERVIIKNPLGHLQIIQKDIPVAAALEYREIDVDCTFVNKVVL